MHAKYILESIIDSFVVFGVDGVVFDLIFFQSIKNVSLKTMQKTAYLEWYTVVDFITTFC